MNKEAAEVLQTNRRLFETNVQKSMRGGYIGSVSYIGSLSYLLKFLMLSISLGKTGIFRTMLEITLNFIQDKTNGSFQL